MILPPACMRPARAVTQAELDQALLQQQGRRFFAALAKFQKPTKRKRK